MPFGSLIGVLIQGALGLSVTADRAAAAASARRSRLPRRFGVQRGALPIHLPDRDLVDQSGGGWPARGRSWRARGCRSLDHRVAWRERETGRGARVGRRSRDRVARVDPRRAQVATRWCLPSYRTASMPLTCSTPYGSRLSSMASRHSLHVCGRRARATRAESQCSPRRPLACGPVSCELSSSTTLGRRDSSICKTPWEQSVRLPKLATPGRFQPSHASSYLLGVLGRRS